MPTYTYTLPANTTVGLHDTGIQLAECEKISSIYVAAPDGFSFENMNLSSFSWRMTVAYVGATSKGNNIVYGYSATGTGVYTVTGVFPQNINVVTNLKGKRIAIWFNATSGSYPSGSLYTRKRLVFTITTTYDNVSIYSSANPSAGGSVTSFGMPKSPGTVLDFTATPATGYKFKNWSATAGTFGSTTSASTTYTVPTSNATVTANFEKQSYTLTTTVSPSGSGSVTAGGSLAYQSTKSLTATAATGYTFSSWSKTAGTLSSTTSNPTTFTMGAGNATVTANFTKNNYTLTTAVSPSGAGTVTAGGSLAYQGTKSLTATAATGYTFSSWSKTAGTLSSTSTNPTTFTMGAGNATVTANFTKNSYALTTAVSPSGAGTVTAGGTLEYQATKSLTATAATGYTFSGWTKTAGTLSSTTSNPTTFTMGAGNATVTANFTKNSYALTTAVSPSGAGTVTAGGTLEYQATKSLTATAATGYTFSGWTKTAGTLSSTTSNPTTFTMGAGNATVTANFTKNSYALTTAVSPSGAGTVTAGGTLEYQATKSLTATAATGYTFSGWTKTAGTLSSTTSNPTNFTMGAGNATVTANFTKNNYTLTTAVSPSGAGTVTAGGSLAYQSTKSLTATANTGYSFSSWSKTGSGSLSSTTTNPTTFTTGAGNTTVTANFTKNSYTLTTAVSPSGGGTVTQGASIQYQGTKSLTATPATGYRFVNWTKTAGTLSSTTSNPTTFTMGAGNATVTANFAKIDYTLSGVVDPSGSGTISFNKSTAQYGDTITITATPDIRYFFDYYGSSPTVTISNNQFTMPASNVTITAYFRPGKSTCSLNASSYSGGDTAILTINASSSSHTHKYNLDFGNGMETGLINVAAGVSVVNIYIPVSWYIYLNGATSKSGGTLTLYTYSGSTLQGSYSIENITYTVLDSTIPSLSVWRTDANGTKKDDGEYGSYTLVKPSSISTWSLSYNQISKNSPASSGTLLPSVPLTFTLGDNHLISFIMVYGNETITVTNDLPAVVKVQKKIVNTL